MNLTNELNLPEPIVNAIRGHTIAYDAMKKRSCDFTTSQLISPIRITHLRGKYRAFLTEDASERIYSLIGLSVHSILEHSADSARYLIEKRFYADLAGARIGGRIDIFDQETATLDDYKICSHHVAGDGIKPEWEAQASINALLMMLDAGIEVKQARIIAIFRDWSRLRAKREKDYPQRGVEILPLKLWPIFDTMVYVNDRIARLKRAQLEDESPVCTEKERWHKPDQWALIKKGNKRATKVFDCKGHIEQWFSDFNQDREAFEVQVRPGEDTRCCNYCDVSAYCSYFQEMMQEKMA